MILRRVTKQPNGSLVVDVSDSTSIETMVYEPDLEILTVTYKRGNGKKYEYPSVNKVRFNKIIDSDSIGAEMAILKKEQSI